MEEKKELKPEELKPEELENVTGGYGENKPTIYFSCKCGFSTTSSQAYSEHQRLYPEHRNLR